jgi:hypothetical protein
MTAPTFDDLDDTSLVPTGKTAAQMGRPAPDQFARTDVASGVSLGARASTTKTVNQVAMFRCDACRGSGRFIRGFNNPTDYGPCNKCKGTGKLKTDPETRAKQKKAREAKKKAEAGAYIVAHTAEYTWVVCNMERFDFASSMMTAFRQYGSWTDGQLAAIRKCMARDEVRAQEKAARKPDAQVAGAGLDRMLQAFVAASASGLRNPKFRVGVYAFSPAKPTSANAGCVYVKRDGVYVGRIAPAGGYFASRDAAPDDRGEIEKICADPLAAAVLHGQQTGRCSCCGLELTNAESIRLGIGPICREKWGL